MLIRTCNHGTLPETFQTQRGKEKTRMESSQLLESGFAFDANFPVAIRKRVWGGLKRIPNADTMCLTTPLKVRPQKSKTLEGNSSGKD